jgi:hypothetical protein
MLLDQLATQNTKSASATHVRAWQKFFFLFRTVSRAFKKSSFFIFLFFFNLHIYTEEGRCLLEMSVVVLTF